MADFLTAASDFDAAAPVGSSQARRRLRRFMAGALSQEPLSERLKFMFRAAVWRGTTGRWLATAEGLCQLTDVAAPPVDLVKKVQTRLAHRRFSLEQRLRLLCRHYDMLIRRLGLEAVGRLLRGERLVTASIVGRSGRSFVIDLRRDWLTRSEGELAICLSEAQSDRALAKLTLIVGDLAEGAPTILWIGGLQGPVAAPDAKAAIVGATRELWGLRPKQAVLEAAYGLAEALGVSAIKAVSRRAHAVRRPFALTEEIKSDYDGFWREMGGVPDGVGAFDLPNRRRRRDAGQVKAGKRKAWRARQDLIASLTTSLGAFKVSDR